MHCRHSFRNHPFLAILNSSTTVILAVVFCSSFVSSSSSSSLSSSLSYVSTSNNSTIYPSSSFSLPPKNSTNFPSSMPFSSLPSLAPSALNQSLSPSSNSSDDDNNSGDDSGDNNSDDHESKDLRSIIGYIYLSTWFIVILWTLISFRSEINSFFWKCWTSFRRRGIRGTFNSVVNSFQQRMNRGNGRRRRNSRDDLLDRIIFDPDEDNNDNNIGSDSVVDYGNLNNDTNIGGSKASSLSSSRVALLSDVGGS